MRRILLVAVLVVGAGSLFAENPVPLTKPDTSYLLEPGTQRFRLSPEGLLAVDGANVPRLEPPLFGGRGPVPHPSVVEFIPPWRSTDRFGVCPVVFCPGATVPPGELCPRCPSGRPGGPVGGVTIVPALPGPPEKK